MSKYLFIDVLVDTKQHVNIQLSNYTVRIN